MCQLPSLLTLPFIKFWTIVKGETGQKFILIQIDSLCQFIQLMAVMRLTILPIGLVYKSDQILWYLPINGRLQASKCSLDLLQASPRPTLY